jgi:DNA-binding GntR family transcriptional regulator
MPTNFRQIWESIAEDLKQAIIRGEIAGGQRLRIDELSLKYGVSNTPIRDAFRHLASLGFVENIPRRMVIVRTISLKEIEDIYAIQSVLEGLAAELATHLCNDDDVDSLDRLHVRLEECVPRGDVEGYSAADVEFHATFLRLCGNLRLVQMVENTRDHIARFRFIMLRHPGRLQESIEEHRRIIAAFRARNADAANREVKHHILVSAELLKRIITQKEASGVPVKDVAAPGTRQSA